MSDTDQNVSHTKRDRMPKKYVMANDAEGRSDVVIDKVVPREGAFDLWINFETPADPAGQYSVW